MVQTLIDAKSFFPKELPDMFGRDDLDYFGTLTREVKQYKDQNVISKSYYLATIVTVIIYLLFL